MNACQVHFQLNRPTWLSLQDNIKVYIINIKKLLIYNSQA